MLKLDGSIRSTQVVFSCIVFGTSLDIGRSVKEIICYNLLIKLSLYVYNDLLSLSIDSELDTAGISVNDWQDLDDLGVLIHFVHRNIYNNAYSNLSKSLKNKTTQMAG